MSGKGTMRKGGVKKTGQRFQNVTAFRHNKNSKTTKKIEELPVNGLCPRYEYDGAWSVK